MHQSFFSNSIMQVFKKNEIINTLQAQAERTPMTSLWHHHFLFFFVIFSDLTKLLQTHRGHYTAVFTGWEALPMMKNMIFTACTQSVNWPFNLLFTSYSLFPISWSDIHLCTRDLHPAHALINIIHAISASVERRTTTREIKWFSGLLPAVTCLSVRPSSPSLSLKWSWGSHSPKWPHLRDKCMMAHGQEENSRECGLSSVDAAHN